MPDLISFARRGAAEGEDERSSCFGVHWRAGAPAGMVARSGRGGEPAGSVHAAAAPAWATPAVSLDGALLRHAPSTPATPNGAWTRKWRRVVMCGLGNRGLNVIPVGDDLTTTTSIRRLGASEEAEKPTTNVGHGVVDAISSV